ncbi:unnamed protein product [Owenia fusiformis]|uniref:Uncharacterized protein n=1 Tax=Owenia fusiformis TaxID=6347 RepID=A0A8J1XGA9_OWEFU|nr:unnamed protein product [Owenia fusiformis]
MRLRVRRFRYFIICMIVVSIYVLGQIFINVNIKKHELDHVILHSNYNVSLGQNQLKNQELNIQKTNANEIRQYDLRVIVLTGSRGSSLQICLDSLNNATYNGDQILLEIWIDRDKKNQLDQNVFEVADKFKFIHGKKELKVHPEHAGIHKQWIDTWTPPEDNKEIGLILEDDIDVSKYFYTWLKKAYAIYGTRSDVAGIGLSTVMPDYLASTKIKACNDRKRHKNAEHCEVRAPLSQTIYMYRIATTWGFAPNPISWRKFQKFYHEEKKSTHFKPNVPGIRHTQWYAKYGETMWSIWHVYHMYINKLYCIFPNLPKYQKFGNHRKEAGDHTTKWTHEYWAKSQYNTMVKTWNETFLDMPLYPAKVDYDGTLKY